MENRSTTHSRNATQGRSKLFFIGGNRSHNKLDCLQSHLPGVLPAMDDCYIGGLHQSRTPSEECGETSLLLPKTSENPGRRRMSLQPSPSPARKSASSFTISPPSDMFCSHGAASDGYSPPLEPEGGRRRGKEPVNASLEIEIRKMNLQEDLPSSVRRSDETKILRSNPRHHSIASDSNPATMQKYVSHSGDSSDEENSDVESAIEDHLRRAVRRSRGAVHFAAPITEMSKIETRLEQWAEARALQLERKLKKKEDEIAEWENLKTMKARMQMRELEVKLEEKRERAMEKMQRTILSAQRKAEKKKQKERASAEKKAMDVVEAIEKRRTGSGKMPCKLICLWPTTDSEPRSRLT